MSDETQQWEGPAYEYGVTWGLTTQPTSTPGEMVERGLFHDVVTELSRAAGALSLAAKDYDHLLPERNAVLHALSRLFDARQAEMIERFGLDAALQDDAA